MVIAMMNSSKRYSLQVEFSKVDNNTDNNNNNKKVREKPWRSETDFFLSNQFKEKCSEPKLIMLDHRYKVWYCSSLKVFNQEAIWIVLQRKDEKNFEEKKLSNSTVWNHYLHENFGPSSFYFRAVGPEILSSNQIFLRSKTYFFRINATLSGSYTFQILHLQSKYDYLNEADDELRQVFNRQIVKGEIPNLQPLNEIKLKEEEDLLPQCTSGLEPGRWVQEIFSTSKPMKNPKRYWTSECLFDDKCLFRVLFETQTEVLEGKWVDGEGEIDSNPMEKNVILDQEHSRGLRWAPYSCKLKDFSLKEATNCLNKKRLLFLGDSHTSKSAANLVSKILESQDLPNGTVLSTVCGEAKHEEGDTIQKMNGVFKFHRNETLCEYEMKFQDHKSTSISYFTSRHGKTPLFQENDFDYIFFNFGQWPAARKIKHNGHWSFDKYQQTVEDQVQNFKSKTKAQLIWVTSTAFPEFTEQMVDDWRNNIRLEIMNQLAKEVMDKYSIPVVDSFSITLPLKISHDLNHFVSFQQDVIVQHLLNQICN